MAQKRRRVLLTSVGQLEDSVNDLAFYLEVFSLLVAEQLIDVIARVVMMLMYDHAVSGFTISTVLPTRTLTPTEDLMKLILS
jgi:hypothetical protein